MDVVQVDHVSKKYVLGQRLNARESLNATAARVFIGNSFASPVSSRGEWAANLKIRARHACD